MDKTTISNTSSGAKRKGRIDIHDCDVHDKSAISRVARKYDLEGPSDTSTKNTAVYKFLLPKLINLFFAVIFQRDFPANDTRDSSWDEFNGFLSYRRNLRPIGTKSDEGFLFFSRAVYEIGITVERFFQRVINANFGFPHWENEFPAVSASTILRELLSTPRKMDTLFPKLDEHLFDQEPEDLCGRRR